MLRLSLSTNVADPTFYECCGSNFLPVLRIRLSISVADPKFLYISVADPTVCQCCGSDFLPVLRIRTFFKTAESGSAKMNADPHSTALVTGILKDVITRSGSDISKRLYLALEYVLNKINLSSSFEQRKQIE